MAKSEANTTFSGARFDHLREMAKEIDVPLYKRFTEVEACDILTVSIQTLRRLRKAGRIAYIQVTERHIQYFGWQILDYLWTQVQDRQCPDTDSTKDLGSADTFSANNPVARPGAAVTTTLSPGKPSDTVSARRILKKRN